MNRSEFGPDMLHRILRALRSGEAGDWQLSTMRGDGSSRAFYRLVLPAGWGGGDQSPQGLVAVLPAGPGDREMAEARASFRIGTHLYQAGVPVPRPFGFDPESGLVVFEDLGDILLHSLVLQHGVDAAMPFFRQAVQELVNLQVKARFGFDPAWCCDTPSYDRRLMLERESGYFLEQFWLGYLARPTVPQGLTDEFIRLADLAAAVPADYLLHRDFQSRNLMLHQERVRIIDFQGARLGPLGYDLAALLNDPYVQLPTARRRELLEHYLAVAARHISLDPIRFVEEYYYMALQRNLQILGAFSYLTRVRNKPFFRDYLTPALNGLGQLLAQPDGHEFPVLAAVTEEAIVSLARITTDENSQI